MALAAPQSRSPPPAPPPVPAPAHVPAAPGPAQKLAPPPPVSNVLEPITTPPEEPGVLPITTNPGAFPILPTATVIASPPFATTNLFFTNSPPLPQITTGPVPTIAPAITRTTINTFTDDDVVTLTPESEPTPSGESVDPSETPYGLIEDDDTNGGTMLIVSLVVVFVVLAGLGFVTFCLFRRRSAKRRKVGLFGSGSGKPSVHTMASSSSELDTMIAAAAAAQPRASRQSFGGASVRGDGYGGDAELNRHGSLLQEMSEQHQSALLTRKSSALSMRSGYHMGQQGQGSSDNNNGGGHPGTRMLSPVLASSRPYSQGSSHWGGSTIGAGTGAGAGGDYGSGSAPMGPEASRDFHNAHYDEYYGAAHAPPQPLYAINSHNGSGSLHGSYASEYSSNEHLLMPHRYSQQQQRHQHSGASSFDLAPRSSLSPGPFPTPNGGEHFLQRPKSASALQTPSSAGISNLSGGSSSSLLIIPPSITTRPRSLMNPSSLVSDAQGGPSAFAPGLVSAYHRQYPTQPIQSLYQPQQPPQGHFPNAQEYYYQQYAAPVPVAPSRAITPTEMVHDKTETDVKGKAVATAARVESGKGDSSKEEVDA
ncbi:hypothetical protein BGZ99_006630 [Dissophora globulifera]|uniref:Uncharacterized protein n=1 Tax=Dissophora globulifera TaxID=979702 RepID=A0A9P6RBN6_9FUNG|nr:hypothetical protein BGZ99_006630 [Dissophora globulifera]